MPETGLSAREALRRRRAAGGRGLVPFLTAGYPDWDLFDRAVLTLAGAGADVLELGVPFSDPLADGPTIQRSSQKALETGVTLASILDRVEEGLPRWKIPVVLMTYANPILALGAERFAGRARQAGVSGVLISDLPPEELPELWESLARGGLETVLLVAPNTAPERVPVLTSAASGYIYCLTRTGVTGKGGAFSASLGEQVERVRRHTDLPVVAGFGIRSAGDVRGLQADLDGVVVGARWIELLESGSPEEALAGVESLARDLRIALDLA